MTTLWGRPPFVGRERERQLLLARLGAAGEGRSGSILVGGEPGIGKTRLMLEVAEQARRDGWRVLAGRAYESDGMPPYLPFAEALREHVRGGSTGDFPAGQDLTRWLPTLAERPTGLSDLDRYRMFEAVTEAVLGTARAGTAGVLLWLDDVHWCDQPSLLLLRHLLRRLEGEAAPLLVAATYRTVELGRGHPFLDFLADVSREQLAQSVLLRSLSLEETGRLIEAVAGVRPHDDLVSALHRETAGNAFYLTEIVRDLCDAPAGLAGVTDLPPERALPQSVRQVIEKRIARLKADTVRLLQAGAVCGDGFRIELVEAVGDIRGAALLDGLDEAITAGMLRDEGDHWCFAHALINQTLYLGLNGARRSLLHRRALDALERMFGGDPGPVSSELAHHAVRAGLDDGDARPFEYARRAAGRALGSLAFEEAVRLEELALHVLDQRHTPANHPHRGEALLDLGDARRRAGRFRAAMTAFQAAGSLARDAGDVEAMARAAIGYEDALLASGDPRSPADASVRIQEEALAARGDTDSVARARLLAGLARASFFGGERERARGLADEAMAVARRLTDEGALAAALNARRITIWGPDDLAGRLAVATELLTVAGRTGDVELELEGRQWRLFALLEVGDTAAFDVGLDAYDRLARQVGQPLVQFKVREWRSVRALLAGRLGEAEAFIVDALERGRRTGTVSILADATLMRFSVGMVQGDCEAVIEPLRGFVERHPELVVWRFILARALVEAEGMAEACALFEELASRDFADVPYDYFRLMILVFAAETCAHLGDRERAGTLYRLLLPYRDQAAVVLPIYLGAVAGYLGLLAAVLGRRDEAEAHFEAAVAANRTAGAMPHLARALADYARMLLDRPDHQRTAWARARRLLDEAVVLYDAFGPHYGARVRGLLAGPAPGRYACRQAVLPRRAHRAGGGGAAAAGGRPLQPRDRGGARPQRAHC